MRSVSLVNPETAPQQGGEGNGLPALREWGMSGCALTDASFHALAKMTAAGTPPKLKNLNVGANKATGTDEGKAALRKAWQAQGRKVGRDWGF